MGTWDPGGDLGAQVGVKLEKDSCALEGVRLWMHTQSYMDPRQNRMLEVGLSRGPADICSFPRNCLLAPGKGPPTLGPSRDTGRSWTVWYRRPRRMALPCPTGDPQAESPAAGYRPLSASSQSSLRSLISAL